MTAKGPIVMRLGPKTTRSSRRGCSVSGGSLSCFSPAGITKGHGDGLGPKTSSKDLPRGVLQMVGHCSNCHRAAGITKGHGAGLGPKITSSFRQRLDTRFSANGGSL